MKERKSWTWALCSAAGHGFPFTLPTGWQLACCWFGGAGQMRGFWVRKACYSHTGDAPALGCPSPPSEEPCGAAGGGCVRARDAQLGTVSGGPGLINSARGKPWARRRPCLALEALDSGPGPERSPRKRQGASLSWHTDTGRAGHGWSPGCLHACECPSEPRHSVYMLRSFGNRGVYSTSCFLCQTTLFPVSSFLWSQQGQVCWAT